MQKKPVKLTSRKNRLNMQSDQNKHSKKRAVFNVLVQKQVSQGKKLINKSGQEVAEVLLAENTDTQGKQANFPRTTK